MPQKPETEGALFLKSVGQRLRSAREAKGLSLRAVGARLNVSHGAVGHWETGHNPIDISTMFTLARLYGVSPYSLLAEQIGIDEAFELLKRQVEESRLHDDRRPHFGTESGESHIGGLDEIAAPTPDKKKTTPRRGGA